MVQNGGGANDVVTRFADLQFPNIALQRGDSAGGRSTDPFDGPVQHGPAEVNQCHIKVGQPLQHLQCLVASAAANIQERCRAGGDTRGCLGDQRQRQWGINGGRLPGLKIGKPVNVTVEALSNLIYG